MGRDFIKDKKKLVVKIGTSSLTFPNGKLNFQRIEVLAKVLSSLHKNGRKIILVSSGAIAVGAGRLGLIERPDELARKQALAAIGQAELIRIYQKFFDVYQQKVAQVLLTRDGVENPMRRNNANNTLNALLDMGIIPIINENDTVSTEEIEFGDNDTLSAIVATLVDADLLVLLSDIDGLYSSDPKRNLAAEIIHEVKDISREIEEMASGAGSNFGKGGMCTKIAAAKICIHSGIDMIIINGGNPASLVDVLNGIEVGTLFKAKEIIKN